MNDDVDYEEKLFYGGQISGKHTIYQEIAQLESFAFIWWMLDQSNKPEWDQKTEEQQLKEIVHTLGQIEFMGKTSELTKLSAIMGDTRKNYDQSGLKDELTSRLYKSPKP